MSVTDHKTNICSKNNPTRPISLVGDTPTIQESEARSVGNVLQRTRREVGLSTSELARLAGVDKSVITKIEKKQGAGIPKTLLTALLRASMDHLAAKISDVTGTTVVPIYRLEDLQDHNDSGVA